ncbi:hypothetical protein JCM10207_002291 [Rhodosporidiobolus poonsookiae]
MFYSTEILTSRKTGLAVFWLAATVGSKGGTSFKKLTRSEVLKSNVVKAWCVCAPSPLLRCSKQGELTLPSSLLVDSEKVITPEEPLALRLSSNLMMGIARVFQQQYTIYASDVSHVHQALKKAITDANLLGPDITIAADLPLAPLPEVNLDAPAGKQAKQAQSINLDINAGIAFVGFDPDLNLLQDWRFPGEQPEDDDLDLGEAPPFFSPLDSREGTPAVAQQQQPRAAYQARQAHITLQEPQLDDYLLQGVGDDVDLFPSGDFGGDQPVFGEGDEGLLYGQSPELDALIRASSAAGSGRGSVQRYGGPSSSAAGALDMGGFDDNPLQEDFGGGFDDIAGVQVADETLAERVRREHEEARARLHNVGDMRRSPTPLADFDLSGDFGEGERTPSSTSRKRVSDALQQAKSKASKTPAAPAKPKKPKLVPIDRSTELTDDAFRGMRASYPDRMAAERKKADKMKEDREAHKRAMDLIFGTPAMFQAPGLADFWKTSVTDQLAPFDVNRTDQKKRRISAVASKKKDPSKTPEAEESRRVRARLSEQPEAFPRGELGDFGDVNLEFGGGEEGEYGRGDMGGFEDFQFDQDVEVARAASEAGLTGSQRPSMLPWAQEAATSDVGGPAPAFGAPSSQAGGTRVSLDTPLRRDAAQRSRQGSVVPSVLGSTPHRAGSVGLLAECDDEFAGFEEARLSRSPSPHPSAAGAAAPDFAALENESLKFLNFARRQRATLAAYDQLLFSDIVPVADTNASVAAQVMYHLLCLATKSMVKVQQDEPYGEARIAVDIV